MVAMTVGATKIQILQEEALASLTEAKPPKSQGEEELSVEEVCST